MKFTEIQKKLMLALGMTATQIDSLETDETKFDVDATALSIREANIKLLKNDAEFISTIQKAEKGRNLTDFERNIKKTFGLTAEEVKDKTAEEIISLAKEKITTGQDKNLTELQAETIELKNKIVALETIEIPKIKGEVEGHKKDFNVENALTKKLAGRTLRNPISVVLSQLKSEFGPKYKIDADESGNITITNKETGLEIKNADGTKLLTSDEIIEESLTRNKFLEESGAPGSNPDLPKPDAKKKVEGEAKKSEVFAPGLSVAEAHLANLKNK